MQIMDKVEEEILQIQVEVEDLGEILTTAMKMQLEMVELAIQEIVAIQEILMHFQLQAIQEILELQDKLGQHPQL
jgi:hypothetical protein